MAMNEYINGQEWNVYDPYEWVMVPSNRIMFHDRNSRNLNKTPEQLVKELDWDHMRVMQDIKQLELTIERDEFVRKQSDVAMMVQATEIVDRELKSLLGNHYEQ